MFGGDTLHSVVVCIGHDPAADDDLPIWRAPAAVTLRGAYLTAPNTIAASSANHFNVALYNGGSAGTALSAIAGTLGGTAAGGTAPGWTALAPAEFTVGTGALDAGDVVVLRYDETGTSTIQGCFVQLDYVLGN